MAKLLKSIVIAGYSAIAIQLILTFFIVRHEDIIFYKYMIRTPNTVRRIARDLNKYPKNVTVIDLNFVQPLKLKNDLKFILKYTDAFSHYSSSVFRNGQEAFIESNCSYYNCFLTNDKNLLLDIRNFDAILFDVENTWDDHPWLRSLHQKYIFTASESSDNYPICHESFEDYYNLTWTYKLDSDIRWTYLTILDVNGTVVGPKVNMSWINPMEPVTVEVRNKLVKKTKAAAWFVSNCFSKSNRINITKQINNALNRYGLEVDIYGWCGALSCPRDRIEDCWNLLEKDYFFYLAFENSMSEDYVTEKLLHALKHYTVPVVYGGADYSRFLPPNSYINAKDMSPGDIAKIMAETMYNQNMYAKYFDWHNHYKYEEAPETADICSLCQILNENPKESTVKNFRVWWNKDYEKWCDMEQKGLLHRVQY